PPFLSRPDPRTGRPRKRSFGGWMMPLLALLARLSVLRETPFDVFGAHPDRALERRLRDRFLARILASATAMTADNRATALELARAQMQVRGFGPVKAAAAKELLDRLEAMQG